MNDDIKLYERHKRIRGEPHDTFLFMDDLAKTGMHMSKRSVMMAGSKLTLVDIRYRKPKHGSVASKKR